MSRTPAPPHAHASAHTAEDMELHALADGRLAPDAAKALQEQLDGEQGGTAQAWARQRQQLQALARQQQAWADDLPPALQAAARQTGQARQQQAQWQRWGGMAAGWLLAFGLGWTGQALWQQSTSPHTAAPSAALAAATPAGRFAQQAAVAHAVYQPEKRHPVEVDASQQEHLVQWLSKRLDRPLKVPDLHAQGYHLVGGRLLPGDSGARAQFMYQTEQGQRITLYLGALAPPAVREHASAAFQYSDESGVPCFYWTEDGFAYALSGALPRAALLTLATAAHRQLGL